MDDDDVFTPIPPEPDTLDLWYIGSEGVDADERRRVFSLWVASGERVSKEHLVPMARAIELYLLGALDWVTPGANTHVTPGPDVRLH